VEQELPRPCGIVVRTVALVVRLDLGADEPGVAVADLGVGLREGSAAVPEGLDLRAGEHQAGLDPVGISTQDDELAGRFDPVVGGRKIANFLRVLTLEAQTLARACGKSHLHNLEPEDLVALTVEAAAIADKADAEVKAAIPTEEPIAAALKIDDLKIELGYALLPLVNGPDGTDRLTEQIKALRRSLAIEMGFVMPAVRILDNVQLEANTYIIKIKEVDAGTGKIWPSQFMVMDPAGNQVSVPGIHTIEPTFGLPATWVDAGLKEEASLKGYTVVDAATVLSTHLTELLKNNMSDLLSYGEVQKLIKDLPKEQGELVKDIVPSQVTISGIQRVLQLLLAERISIRDLSTILEGIADALAFSRNPATMVEHVRARLARQICAQNTSPNGYLPLIALSAKWEQAFAESLIGQGEERSLAMQPSKLSEFMNAVRDRFEQAAREGEAPVLVTSAAIRPFVRSLVERFRSQTTVLSQAEIHPRARLKTVGSV